MNPSRQQQLLLLLLSLVIVVATGNNVIRTSSRAGQILLQHATPVVDDEQQEQQRTINRQLQNNNNNADYSYIAEYSIKFQGCHHVQQWNDNVDDNENDVRIMTKRLARFRLCPTDSCSNDKSSGCTTKYGDYIVDMDTFVEAYLTAMEDEKEDICADAATDCSSKCGGDAATDDCMVQCYASIDLSYCLNEDGQYENNFNPMDYAFCQQFRFNNGGRQLEDAAAAANNMYYVGAFCADQGGDIHLGLFTDDTCTSFASNGYTIFQTNTGYAMPYSETSLVTTRCLSCGHNNGNGNFESKQVCELPYAKAGKCETRMSIDYPNESTCNYIEGIKIIREDGVIRTSSVKKSKAAAVGIGLFTTLSVLLAAYVYYLRTKLARAQINLAAAAQAFS